MEISIFRNFWDTKPVTGTLEAMVEAVRSDGRTMQLTLGYRQEKRDQLKNESMLFAVPCIFDGGKASGNVVRLTGLAMVDFDHVVPHPIPHSPNGEGETCGVEGSAGGDGKSDRLMALRQKIIADPHTLLCYTTISGEGLRVIYRYELDEGFELKQQVQFYKKVFATGNAYYERLCGAETDAHCKNVTRLTVVAHDPDVYFNPDAEAFTAAWIESQWQTAVEAEKLRKQQEREKKRIQACYDARIRPEVEADGAVYAPGNHNDYVMRVGYKLNQFGFTKEMAMAWVAETFSDYDKAADVVSSCYEKTEEHGTRKPRPSTSKGGTGAQGANAFASVEDIRQFLTEHVQLRHNTITGRVESLTPPPLLQERGEERVSNGGQ